jgi:hypothetical protein
VISCNTYRARPPAALAGQIAPDLAEIVLALGREDVARH